METKNLLNKKITQWLLLVAMLIGCGISVSYSQTSAVFAFRCYHGDNETEYVYSVATTSTSCNYPGVNNYTSAYQDADLGTVTGTWYIKAMIALNWKDAGYTNGIWYYWVDTNSQAEKTFKKGYDWGGWCNNDWRRFETDEIQYTGTSYSVGEHWLNFRARSPWYDNGLWYNNGCDNCYYAAKFTIPGFTDVSSSTLNFDDTMVGSETESQSVTFKMYGSTIKLTTSTPTNFTVSTSKPSGSGKSGSVTVTFKPTSTGDKSETLTLTDNYGKTTSITLKGKGIPACTDPTATQYPMTNNNKTLDNIVAPTITPASGAGTVETVYYTGINGTTYPKNSTLPSNAGTYKVTVDVNAGDTYCAKNGIELSGNFVIEQAKIKLTSDAGKQGDKFLGDYISNSKDVNFTFDVNGGITTGDYPKAVFFTTDACSDKLIEVDATYAGWWTWNGYTANIKNVQFTKTGTWYVKGEYRSTSSTPYAYTKGKGTESYNTDLCASGTYGTSVDPYWVVSALPDATNLSATAESTSEIDLSWTHNATYTQVMVVRYEGENPSVTAPTQGQEYSVDDAIGGGTVIYNGTNGTFNDTGLNELTTYTYYLYTVNNNYYATGVSVSATTKSACTPPTITTGSVTGIIKKRQALGVTGSVTGGSGCTVTAIGIAYKATDAAGAFSKQKDGSKTSGDISVDIGDLTGGTEYTYKAYATVNGVDLYGEEGTFTTCSNPSPVATATFNKGKGYPWEQGTSLSGTPDPTYKGYFGTNDDQRTITLETSTVTNYYQWYTCEDADGENPVYIPSAYSRSCNVIITAPGIYYYMVKAGCDGADIASNVVTVNVPYPEMGITGPGVKYSNGWTESYASGDGKLTTPTSGNVWTGMFRISEDNDKQFMVIQRHKLDVCAPSSKDGWCASNNIKNGWGTVTVTGGTITGGVNITPDNTKFSSGDSVKIIVTMTAPNAYNVKLVRLNKERVAVKSWGNDNNTSVLQNEWLDLLDYTGPVLSKPGVQNYIEDYLLPDQQFTVVAKPYITDGNVHRSVFLGWSTTEDGWNPSTETHRQVSMSSTNETYQFAPSGDINLYAHFAFINTNSPATVTCENVVVTGSANSYADNINLNNAPYNCSSSIGYKIGESGSVTKVAITTGDLITTWANGAHTGHPRDGWEPVSATLENLNKNQEYKSQLILTKSETDYSAYEWTTFTTLPVPTITVSPASPKAYEVITLGTQEGGNMNWAKTDANAYFVKDMKAVDGNTVENVASVILKAPSGATSSDYTITATPDGGCTGTKVIRVSADSEVCN